MPYTSIRACTGGLYMPDFLRFPSLAFFLFYKHTHTCTVSSLELPFLHYHKRPQGLSLSRPCQHTVAVSTTNPLFSTLRGRLLALEALPWQPFLYFPSLFFFNFPPSCFLVISLSVHSSCSPLLFLILFSVVSSISSVSDPQNESSSKV